MNEKYHNIMLLNMISMFVKTFNEGVNENFKEPYKDSYDYTISMLNYVYRDEYCTYASIGIAFILEYGLLPEDEDEVNELYDRIYEEDDRLNQFLPIYENISNVFRQFHMLIGSKGETAE